MLKDPATHSIGRPAASSTLGARLGRHRLEHRARRLRLAIAALGERRVAYASTGHVPPALHQAIRDFSLELSSIETELDDDDVGHGMRR